MLPVTDLSSTKPEANALTAESYPGFLYEFAQAGHREAADTLVRAYGGQSIVVPKVQGHQIEQLRFTRLIGPDAARWLIERFGVSRLYIPLATGVGAKKRAILAHPGGTAETARAVGCSHAWVRRVRNQLVRPDDSSTDKDSSR